MNLIEPGVADAAARATVIDPVELRRRVKQLPALPQAATQVLASLRDEHAGVERCAEQLSHDAALAARVLRLANSAFYGVPGRVGNIGDAIQLLGRRTVSAVITTAAVSAQIPSGACPGFDHGVFWRHTMATALAAQQIARLLVLDDDIAFTAGLMHDMGRLALAAYYPSPFAAAIAAARADDAPLLRAERAVLSIDHAAVGALLAEQWHFPPDVARAIAEHHDLPGVDAGHGRPTIAEIVHVADAVAHALDLAGDPHEMVPPVHSRSWQRIALSPTQYAEVFEHTERGVAALGQALAL